MKTRILKALCTGAAALALSMPASALPVNINLDVVGQSLNVTAGGAGGLLGETIAGYDLNITFNNALDGFVTSVVESDQLGAINFLDYLFFDSVTAGNVNGFGVSFLSSAMLQAVQTSDPVLLFTVNFGAGADLGLGNFAVGPLSTVVCSGPNGPFNCFPDALQVPEPTTGLLVATALGALALRRKKPQLA